MYTIKTRLLNIMTSLKIIADEKDNYYCSRLSNDPLFKIECGKVETENDEFVIKEAETIEGGLSAKFSIEMTIRYFIATPSIGKALLLKSSSDGPYIRITIIDDNNVVIDF